MSKEIDRREFLRMTALGIAGFVIGGCGKKEKITSTPIIAEQPTNKLALAATELPTEKVVPTATATPEIEKKIVEEITLINVPEDVDGNIVDVAKGEFENKTGVAPHIFAEPGGLLVGPDFGYEGEKNPWGNNPEGWDKMYESGGSIQPISPVSQEVIRWPGEAYQNLPEGGFVFFSGGQMEVNLGEITIDMPRKGAGHNYFFVARGLYSDGQQDIDRNIQVRITNYIPGHTEVSAYQSRNRTNLAFISEEQFLQKVATSHASGTNCGAEGCSALTLVALDVNTGALEIYNHRQGETESLAEALTKAEEGWQLVYSNYREAK